MSDSRLQQCPTCGASLDLEGVSGCPRCLMLAAMQPTAHPEGAERTPPPSLATVSAAFPQLEVLELIGQGGMGCVFKARQPQLNRFVALKILPEALSRDAAFAARFTREAQALAALSHPNIVTIHDFGQAGSGDAEAAAPRFFYLLMEFVDGVNLRQALRGGHFTPEQALAIVPPLCDALQFAHERGIVHRDIKPENLLLDKAGRIKVADFGIAKMLASSDGATCEAPGPDGPSASAAGKPPFPSFLTADNATAGTPGYMAPEQKASPQKVDSRADIYSLGVVLYEMLTGELPADRLQPPSSRIRGMQIDVRLDEIVLRALEQTPELRYQTAAELRTQVETVVGTPPPSGSNPAGPTSAKVTSPRLLKVGTSTLVTPAYLATARGQFFAYRTRGQLVLDDRQLTHTAPPALVSAVTVIPLAAIRDVSIGQYPLAMNPLGIDLLSVTYEEGGQRKQVLLSPMEGFFALPSTWNARAAEWATAIREAVTAATGRAPTTTPSEQLGVPGSHVALLTMFLMPLVPLGVFVACLTALTSPGAARHNTSLLSTFAIGIAAFGFFLLFTKRRWMKSPTGSAPPRSPWHIALGVLALVAVLPIAALLTYFLSNSPSPGVSNFICIPVGVNNNVVIVEVNAEVASGGAEVQAALEGPKLSPAIEAGLAETFFPPFAGTLVKPTPFVGNRPWRIWSAGPQTWRLGFVLPDAALAQEAFENLRPIGPLFAEPRRTLAGTLFEVGQPGGAEYRASLNVTPPVGSADPNWVSAWAMTTYNESGANMNWQVEASQPGIVFLHREGGQSTASLRRDPKTKLYQTAVSLELTKVGTNRVRLVSRIGGVTAREELTGSFPDLSAELLRYKNMSTKTVRGAEIELCQFQGKPVTVQVPVLISTVTTPAAVKVVNWSFPFYGLIALCVLAAVVIVVLMRKGWSLGKVLLLLGGLLLVAGLALAVLFYLWSARSGGMPWIGGIRLTMVGVMGLFIVLGVIALLVLLARKGGTAGKVMALVIAVPLLLLVLAVAALFGWRKVASDFGPGVGLVRLSQANRMLLESSRATQPLALFTPVIDPSLGDGSYRLVSTLVKPRQVVFAEVALVDDRYSTAHTISQLGFYLGSADGTTNASARVTWSVEKVTEGEGAWIVRVGGEGGGSKFERIARLGSRNKGFVDILVTPAQPENPDRGAETSLDDATTTWVAVRPERSHWVGPGEWNVGEWNSLTLFEARDDKGKVQRRLLLKLLLRPMLADANVPWNGTLLRNGDWETDLELRALIGGPPAGQPKSETPSVVPAPKPAPRGEVHKAGIPAETAKPTANAKPPLTERDYARVGVPTATLTPPLTNWSAEHNGLRLGMRLPETPPWRIGGQVGVQLWVANVGAEEVKFGHSPRTDAGLSVIARDKDGKEHRAQITQYRGMLYYLPWLLPPSHSVKVMEFNVRFDPPGTSGEQGRDAVFQLAAGDYTLHCVWTTPRLANAPTTDWEGKLTSAGVEMRLMPE